MSFKLTVLGISSATFNYGRHQSAQFLEVFNTKILLDCGEGTQIQLKRFGLKAAKINVILISHMHGDHFLGLFGLLSSMSLGGRKTPLTLVGPKGLREVLLTTGQFSFSHFSFPIEFIENEATDYHEVLHFSNLKIYSFPLKHGIPCSGFYIEEDPKPRKIIKEKVPKNVRLQDLAKLKRGQDILTDEGETVSYKEVTLPALRSRSFAYFSDTTFVPEIAKMIPKGVDILYHESTFLEEHRDRAELVFHSTATDAAKDATIMEAKKLLLGHFSARYKVLAPFKEEAEEFFSNVEIAEEGITYEVKA